MKELFKDREMNLIILRLPLIYHIDAVNEFGQYIQMVKDHRPLPLDKIMTAIKGVSVKLERNKLVESSNAILTTDTKNKIASIKIGSAGLCGFVKGAGMIEPSMATMLCFITSDVSLPYSTMNQILKETVNKTFNRISVDGDMSTNDSVVILWNGASEMTLKTPQEILRFREALLQICSFLSQQIIKDGEGATKTIKIKVTEAKTEKDAESVARSIANSLLLKCALYGESPNWGRIVSSVGATKARIHFPSFKVFVQGVLCFGNHEPNFEAHSKLQKAMQKKEIEIDVVLGAGNKEFFMLGTDLSHQYVDINRS